VTNPETSPKQVFEINLRSDCWGGSSFDDGDVSVSVTVIVTN
jgi:hypothetical protein